MLPQEIIGDDQALFSVARMTQYGSRVFDTKMSDVEEMQFLQQVVGKDGKESVAASPDRGESLAKVRYQLGTDIKSAQSDPDLATRVSSPTNTSLKKDFLTETLHESRKMFRQKSTAQNFFSQMDQSAFGMIQAETKLDGVVISDAERVIEDFHNTKLYKDAADQDEYNFAGHVPKVNLDLA